MVKKIIFQDSFLVSGIMCHEHCGTTVRNSLSQLTDLQRQGLLPADTEITIDAEPQAFGIHRIFITLSSDIAGFNPSPTLSAAFKTKIEDIGFELVADTSSAQKKKEKNYNRINILINAISILTLIILTASFPPSLLLTIGLTSLSFLTTAFTARHYLLGFIRNLRYRNMTIMPASITLGWFSSLAHTLYHSISMPLARSFSMTFMNFLMPVMLIAIINTMDELKRLVLNQSKKMHLRGVKALFPQMAEQYECYELAEADALVLSEPSTRTPSAISTLLSGKSAHPQYKNTLKEGMVIKVKKGDCFPVDGMIIQGNTYIDASILTGEPQQHKKPFDLVPAGAINLSEDIIFYSTTNGFDNTINKVLFSSNRALNKKLPLPPNRKFIYFYTTLIIISIAASILLPISLGLFTIPLILENVTGVLFAICPCTIAIAHELPKLLSIYQRNKNGILLREPTSTEQEHKIHTIVFDKTGTLTTGFSQVDSSEGISQALWQRIFLLEANHGADHPIAKAISRHCIAINAHQSLISDVSEFSPDADNRGLSARVQGKDLCIGNRQYLESKGIVIPSTFSAIINQKLTTGFTPVYIAEDRVYKGVILIKHELRKDILASLRRLKEQGIKLIMLTGDTTVSAKGFNQQNGQLFTDENIHAESTPLQKEAFLKGLLETKDIDPTGVWFIGDGLNDAPCSRLVSEKKGISASMTPHDKAAFFTDISLNGSLDYVFAHNPLNRLWKKNILQNQWLLAYAALALLTFIIGFSVLGIAVSPLIPMMIMVSTTLFTLFNSYRVKLGVDNMLSKNPSWLSKRLASDESMALLITSSTLFMTALLIATISTGGLALPAITFTAGVALGVSTACLLASGVMMGLFSALGIAYLVSDKCCIEIPRDTAYEASRTTLPAGIPSNPQETTTPGLRFFRGEHGIDTYGKPAPPSGNPAAAMI